jgi:hypothetical protein
MSDEDEIVNIFRKMGIGSEKDRKKFRKMAPKDESVDSSNEYIFIRVTSTTSNKEDSKDAELA